MKKILYIILSGLGDLPVRELGDKTPLEAAFSPNLDRLAQKGLTGILYPGVKGYALESDCALIALLGYDLDKYYPGRAPLEAYAGGVPVEAGDLVMLADFVITEDGAGKDIIGRRGALSLTREEFQSLARDINSKITLSEAVFDFKPVDCCRSVAVIRAQRSRLCAGLEEAAKVVNEFSEKIRIVLRESEVNKKRVKEGIQALDAVVFKGISDRSPKLPSFKEVYNLKFASLSDYPLAQGIASLAGIEDISIECPAPQEGSEYLAWADIVCRRLKDFDGLFIYIKRLDVLSHRGEFYKKKAALEELDKLFFGPILGALDLNNTVIAVTGEHSTPCALKEHSADGLPLVISGGGIKPDGSLSFCEKSARLGSLGEMQGKDLLPKIIMFAHL